MVFEKVEIFFPSNDEIGNNKSKLWLDIYTLLMTDVITTDNSAKTNIEVRTYIDGILPKDPTRHAYAWQIGPFWQDTLDMSSNIS